MRRNTKKEIIDMAKQLFNERGFNSVSIRDIADALGISNGNVTYHFNKKEEIIEAILEESANLDTKPTESPQSLAELDAFFLDMQRTVQENAFYFWHHAQLSQLSPNIRDKQKLRYDLNVRMLNETFSKLKSDGLIRSECYTGEYERIIDTLLLSNIYWMPFCTLKDSLETEDTYQTHAWSIMYYLLSDTGHKQVLQILDK